MQGARPHSKPPFLIRLTAGVGAQLALDEVEVGVANPRLQEQAELIFCLSAEQPAVTRAGRPIVAALTVLVYVLQKEDSDEYSEEVAVGRRAL